MLGYQDVYAAADAVPEVRGYRPIGLEGMDDRLVEDLRRNRLHVSSLPLLPEGRGWLLVEFGGESRDEARAHAQHLIDERFAPSCYTTHVVSPGDDHRYA